MLKKDNSFTCGTNYKYIYCFNIYKNGISNITKENTNFISKSNTNLNFHQINIINKKIFCYFRIKEKTEKEDSPSLNQKTESTCRTSLFMIRISMECAF